MIRSISSETVGSSSRSEGGSSEMILNRSAVIDSPRNARCPATISYRTQPTENRSLRPSRGRPFACSGLM